MSKKLKNDAFKYLGIVVDFRIKRFKELGKEATFKYIQEELNKNKEYRKTVEKRKKQIITQKRYETKKRDAVKQNTNATKIQREFERNKLWRVQPKKCWYSYFKYRVNNNKLNLSNGDGYTYNEIAYHLMNNQNITGLDIEDFKKVFHFYKVSNFILSKLKESDSGIKMSISFNLLVLGKDNIVDDFQRTLKAKSILNKSDVYKYVDDVFREFIKIQEKNYMKIVNIENVDVIVHKMKALNGSSYIPLPEKIANKKAVINIKNDKDNNCFIYSVLCGYLGIYDKDHPERISHYYHHLKELIYDEKDMPMRLDKIIFFEKRNKLRINVYGLDEKNEVIPLYVSSNKLNEDYKLISLLFISDGSGKNHYTYIKNFDKLMCSDGKHKNYVCPYCCNFKTTNADCLNSHKQYCISGQKVEMPKENSVISFKHFNNLNQCPIRIYADFESIKDVSKMFKSKNEKTTFTDAHIGVSFKILVVSDIPISCGLDKVGDYYVYESIYKGLDANVEFVRQIQELENILINDMLIANELHYDFKKMIITEDEMREFNLTKSCWICNNEFSGKNYKVKHHNHFTGKYDSTICSNCNIQIKDKIIHKDKVDIKKCPIENADEFIESHNKNNLKIPVIFHNLNYDKNILFKSLYNYENVKNISILPDNEENYKCFTIGGLHFIDSFRFMASSLDALIKNLPNENKIFLKSLCKSDIQFDYMNKKGYFPYEWFDDIKKLQLDINEVKKENFNNRLKLEKLNDDEWEYIQQLIKDLEIKTFEEYHDFYLNIDVNGLADVFENFRKTSIKTYKLDPCHYVGTPSFGWDAMLLKTKVKLDLLTDSDMYQFFERGIRGGQSVIFKKYAEANNKYLSNYDENKPSTYISYLDANNLYGVSMSCKLPINNFNWVEGKDITIDMIENYNEVRDDIAQVILVDIKYPKELHKYHNDYPLCPERFKPNGSICHKLCGTFLEKKNYVVHIKNLQLYLSLGMKITKIHRAVSFNQSYWLKEWIDLNTNLRKIAKNDFEKDYFKLMNNAVFGKTMENVRDRIDLKVAFDEDYYKKYVGMPNFNSSKILVDDKMMLMKLDKKTVKLDKPIYAGFTILELSKYHMYDFHYNIMKPKYGDKIELMMTDTDSLVYHIETEDFYKDMYEMREHFDMSEYSKTNPIYDETNKKVIGKFKDETGDKIITKFVGVRSKVYAFETDDLEVKKKLKGIPKVIVKKQMSLNDYTRCVLENKEKIVEGIIGFRTKDLCNYTIEQSKKALSNHDDKRIWDGINSYAYGYEN